MNEEVKRYVTSGYSNGKRLLGQFCLAGAAKNDMWQFFNPKSKNWEFLRILRTPVGRYSHSIIVRNGWAIRKVQKGRPPYYFSVDNRELKPITPSAASTKAYSYSKGVTEVIAIKKNRTIQLDMFSVYLPQKQYNELLGYGQFLNGNNQILHVPESVLFDVENLLKSVGIRLKLADEWFYSKSERTQSDLQQKISDLLTLVYSKYLKKESEIENLLISLLTRDLVSIIDPEVREKLCFLVEEKSQTDEDRFLSQFLSEKVATYFDWKFLQSIGIDSTISGLIIRTVAKEYSGKWTNNYYKIIIPNLESVIHLQTTISPLERGIGKIHPLSVRLSKISLSKWRLYPYLGKIKNTGTSDEVRFEDSEKDFIESCFTSVTGIPSIELILRDLCYLDSFKLDLEEWKGSYNLTRYFLTYVKVVEPLDDASRVPSIIVSDFFGNTFKIAWDFDTYLHYAEKIHGIEKGGYISLLIENKLNNSDNISNNVDFETVFGISYRFVNRAKFIFYNILALLKYLAYVSTKDLEQLTHDFYPDVPCDNLIKNLQEEHFVLQHDNLVHYLYRCLNNEQMSSILKAMQLQEVATDQKLLNQKWYTQWFLMRESISTVHPLIYSEGVYNVQKFPHLQSPTYKKILDFCTKTKELHKETASNRSRLRTNFIISQYRGDVEFQETLVGTKPNEVYNKHASFVFLNFGQAAIKARGQWIAKAHEVAKFIARRFSYMEPTIKRIDRMVKNPTGRYVREVEFNVEAYKIG